MRHPKLDVAVVGVGYLGAHHARVYAEMPEVALVAVVDDDARRAEKIAAQYACAAFSDVRDLPDTLVAASVATPTSAHCDVACALLDRGVHVLLEKPMTATLAEADRLIAHAEARHLCLQIGHVERFNAGFIQLQAQVRQPRFIECHRMGPFAARGTDVHVILDLMIHDLDIVLALIPSEVVEVRAMGVPVLTRHTDIANVRLAFANGAVANLTASRVSANRLRKIRVFEPSAYTSLDYLRQELVLCRRDPPVVAEGAACPTMSTETVAIEKAEPLRAEIAAFVRAVVDQTPPRVSGQEGRRALALALAIEEEIGHATSVV